MLDKTSQLYNKYSLIQSQIATVIAFSETFQHHEIYIKNLWNADIF